MRSTDIVAYTFNADVYCPACIGDTVADDARYDGWRVAHPAVMSAEDNLNEIAAAFQIDRDNEHSFHSDDFPKVVFAGDEPISCGQCGEVIIDSGECSECGTRIHGDDNRGGMCIDCYHAEMKGDADLERERDGRTA